MRVDALGCAEYDCPGMSRAARSIFVWSFYLFGLGGILLVSPNVLLAVFAMPPTHEVWIRILAMFLLFVGLLYQLAARREDTLVFRWSAVRLTVPIFFGAFVAIGEAPPVLMAFSVLDVVATGWTFWALKRDAAGARA